jgi:hypothetical protein
MNQERPAISGCILLVQLGSVCGVVEVFVMAYTIDEEDSSIVFWEMNYCDNSREENTDSSVR